MKICRVCKQSKPFTEFNKHSKNKDGLQNKCRECSRESSRQWYSENKATHRSLMKKAQFKRLAETRVWLTAYLRDHPCVDCGNSDMRVLEFDHVRGEKTNNVTELVRKGYSLDNIKKEIDKCEVRCANCHRIKTIERGGHWRLLGPLV